MPITRRRLIVAAASLPALLVAHRSVGLAGDLVDGAIKAARPAALGTSATRCAQCGSPDHAMLDPRCPLAPRVLG